MARKIEEIMTPNPATCPVTASAKEAASVMREMNVGDVLVTETDGTLCGIVTDRDIAIRVVAEGSDPSTTVLARMCSRELATLAPDDDEDRAIEMMRTRAIRRIPVTKDGKPVGVVSLGDLAVERDRESVLGEISAAQPNA